MYAIRYYINGQLSPDNHRSYCILDSLQEEYLHQTYNSMPDMATKLNKIISDPEWNLYNASRAEVRHFSLQMSACRWFQFFLLLFFQL